MAKKLLITVCGRAGSKGFKNKNLKTFCGKPLVHYTLSAIELFLKQRPDIETDVVVNTDSGLLKDLVCNTYPEVVPIHRPAALCGDTVPKMAVFQQSLAYMEEKRSVEYDYLMDLDITSPLRRQQDAAGIFAEMESRPDLDVVLSMVPSRRNPYMNMALQVGDHLEQTIPNRTTARQQAPACYDINASLYVFTRKFLTENTTGFLWDGKCSGYIMEDTAILDIDSEEDFEMMQIFAQHLYHVKEDFAVVRNNIR